MGERSHAERYLAEASAILERLDAGALEDMALRLARLRDGGGRLFVLGVGGGAANASHAVNDLRVLAGLEAYAPTDNVAELTARANDAGWEGVFVEWLAKRYRDANVRAAERVKKLLASYEPPPIDPAQRAAIEDYLVRRKAAIPDAWH